MMYSVWDHARRTYDYFQTGERNGATQAPKPSHLRTHTLGMTPEEASWPLPSNARRVGSGKYPKGRIAARKGALSGLGLIPDMTPTNVMLMGALGFMVYKFMWKPRYR